MKSRVLLALVPLLVPALQAAPPAQVVVEWSAASGSRPDEVAPASLLWSHDPCGAATATFTGGALRVDSSACASQIHAYQYTRSPATPTPLPSVTWVEARVQLHGAVAPAFTIGSASLRLYPGPVCPYSIELEPGQASLRYLTSPGGALATTPVDTTSAPRVWRLEVDHGAGLVRARVDGQIVMSAPTATASTCSFTPGFEGRVGFGDYWQGNGGVTDWFWIRHNLGVPVQQFCLFPTPNSAGLRASIEALGSRSVAQNSCALRVTGAPSNVFGYFLCSRVSSEPRPVVASQGALCLSGAVGRFNRPGEVTSTGAFGTSTLALDLGDLPQPGGAVAALPGERWSFQYWYRDANPGPTSNLSSGVELRFE